MEQEVVIQADRRDIVGKQVKQLRKTGKLPAILYGRHIEPLPISLDLREASRILPRLSPSALIRLQVDGEEHYALVRGKQRDILRGTLRHIDFQAVSLTETVRTYVSIELVGEAPAVEEHGGILVPSLEQLDIEALPRDLPERITVDVSGLEEVGQSINVRDLNLPGEVTIYNDPDDVIAVVTYPAAEPEVEEEELEEVAEELEPELIERRREEEGGEGKEKEEE
jgi:large subunit ribosomal protein L25